MRYNKKIFLILLGIVLPLFLAAMDDPSTPKPVQNPGKQSVWNFSGARAEKFTSLYFAQDTNATMVASLKLLANRYINRYVSDLPPAKKQIMVNSFVTIGSLMLPDIRICKKPEESINPDVQDALEKAYEIFMDHNSGVIKPSVEAFEKFIDIFATDIASTAILTTPDTFAKDIKVLSQKELLCYAPASFIAHKKSIDNPGFLGKVGGWFGGAYRGVKKALGATGRFIFSTIAPQTAVVDWMRMPFFAAVVAGIEQGVIVAPSKEAQMHIEQAYQRLLPIDAYVYLRIIADSIVCQQVITWLEIMKAGQEGKPEGEVSGDIMQLVQIGQWIDVILQKNADIFTPTDLKKCVETIQQAVMNGESITAEKLSELSDQTYAHYLLNPKTISVLMYNQKKADTFVQNIHALWEIVLPGEQTITQLRSFLTRYAPQAVIGNPSEQQPEPELKDAGTIDAEDALPAKSAEEQSHVAEGVMPTGELKDAGTIDTEGALPAKSAEGQSHAADGAMPTGELKDAGTIDTEVALPAKSAEGKRRTVGSAVPAGEKKDTGKMGEFNLGDTKDTYQPHFGAPSGFSSSATPSASGSSSGTSTSGNATKADRSSTQAAHTPSSGASQPYYGSGRAPYKPSATHPGYGSGGSTGYGTSFGGQQQAPTSLAGTAASGTKDVKVPCWHQSEVDDGSLCIDVFTGPFYPTHGEVVHQEQACIYTKKAVGESKKLCLVEEEKAIQPLPVQLEVKKSEQVKKNTWFTPTVIVWSAGAGIVMIVLIILTIFAF